MKRAWIVLLATMVLVVPARCYAAFSLFDPQKGFYTDGGMFSLVTVFLTVAGIAAAILLSRKAPAPPIPAEIRSAPSAALAALAGLFVGGQAILSVPKIIGSLSDVTGIGETAHVVQVLNLMVAVAGLFATVTLLMSAYDFGLGETLLRRKPLVALLTPLWSFLSLISLFMTYVATANRFDHVYHTCTTALILLFLFSQAKLFAGIDTERGAKQVLPYGFAAAVFAISDAVPNLALAFTRHTMLGSFPLGMHLVNLVLTLYILVYLSAAFRIVSAAETGTAAQESEAELSAEATAPASAADPENTVGTEKAAADQVIPECLDFLRKAYPAEESFRERAQISVPEIEKQKS